MERDDASSLPGRDIAKSFKTILAVPRSDILFRTGRPNVKIM